MRGTAPKEDKRWVLARAPAYLNALQAVGRGRFRHAYRHLLEAERVLISTEGNPPGVMTVEKAEAQGQVGSADLIEEASAIDQDYDEELFEHHAPRARCFIYKGILVCFTVCEVSEVVTMTTFRLPDEIFTNASDSVSSDMRGYGIIPIHPRPDYTMELRGGSTALSEEILLYHVTAAANPVSKRYKCDLSNHTSNADLELSLSRCALKDVARSLEEADLSCYAASPISHTLSLRSLKLIRAYYTMLLLK